MSHRTLTQSPDKIQYFKDFLTGDNRAARIVIGHGGTGKTASLAAALSELGGRTLNQLCLLNQGEPAPQLPVAGATHAEPPILVFFRWTHDAFVDALLDDFEEDEREVVMFESDSICGGDGSCFNQIDVDVYEQSPCSHGCELIECKNYKHCGKKRPELFIRIHGGMDYNCASMTYDGKITFTDTHQECPVCYDEKYMIKLPCEHLLCLTCLYGMYGHNENLRVTTPVAERTKCPLCRTMIHPE